MTKKKTSDVPTRIYSYRCLPPTTEAKRVEDQYRLAHQYRNAHVEIELRLRERLRDAQLAIPEVQLALNHYESADAAVESAYEDLRAAKSGVADPDLTAHRERLAAEKELRALRSNELREVKRTHHEDLLPGYEAVREKAHAERLAARKDYSTRGLRHGAYIRVEEAIQQATRSTKRPLHFERYDGTGSIGQQLTETKASNGVRGMTVNELHSCHDPRLRLEPLPENYWQLPRNHRRHAARLHMWLRIGSNPDRSPIFAEFPVTIHRPLPKDAIIKWAYVVRKKIGHHYEWRFQLTIESETFRTPTQAVGEGTCAIDLGWRRIFDDEGNQIGLRAGYAIDEHGKEREILVPEKLWRGMGKIYDLAKIRDQSLERAQFALSNWLVGRTISEWAVALDGERSSMLERLRGYDKWRSPRKLQAFIDRWCDRRITGDEEIFLAMQAWAKQDRHLQSWQEHQRDRLIAHRRETWRVIATELARTYAVLVVEDGTNRSPDRAGTMKLPNINGWERPAPEDGDPSDGREQRQMSRLAAVGELRAEFAKAASKTGARVEIEKAVNSTLECAWCSHVDHFDAAAELDHQCTACHRTWDQDANACRNLLHRHGLSSGPVPTTPPTTSSPVPPVEPQALAPRNHKKALGSSGSVAAPPSAPQP